MTGARRIVALLALACALGVVPPTATSAGAQTTEYVLSKYVAARGGRAKLDAVKSRRLFGKLVVGSDSGPIVIEAMRPDLLRTTVIIGGQRYIRGFDGRSAWEALDAPSGGVRPMSPIETRNISEEADFDGPLVNPARAGDKVAYVGRATVDGRNTYKLSVTLHIGSGYVDYYYLDPTTFLPVMWEGTRSINNQMATFESRFPTYRTFGGLPYPVLIETSIHGGPTQRMTIDSVVVNPSFGKTYFTMPKFENGKITP